MSTENKVRDPDRPLSPRCLAALAQAKTLSDQIAEDVERKHQAEVAELNEKLDAALRRITELGGDKPSKRFPGDPGLINGKVRGLYLGCNVDGGTPVNREAFYKKKIPIYRSYWQPSQTDAMIAVCRRDLEAGRIPFASTKLPVTSDPWKSWSDVADGKQEAWVKDQLDKLGQLPGPVWYCWNHEPTDDGQPANDYKRMQQYLYPKLPPNVALVPILQSAPFDTTVYGNPATLDNWIDPTCIDVAGIDTYNHWYPGGTNRWREPAVVAQFFQVMADHFGKPIALAEFGVRSDPANPGRAAEWMKEFRDILVARGDVVAMSFFDSAQHVNDGGTPWTLDYNGDQERLIAFRDMLSAPGSIYLSDTLG